MEYSRNDEKSLGGIAHELLRDISTRMPEILKAHVQEICMSLQDVAPNTKKPNDPGAVDNLKACASFASRYPDEMPRDRKFVQAMTSFALHGTPAEAAKHAVTIMMTASDKKELLAKELVGKCIKNFNYGGDGFLSRLAALSQLMLLAPDQANQESDAISGIVLEDVLLQVRNPALDSNESYEWSAHVEAECEAKCWALKILVNRIRSYVELDSLSEIAGPVYTTLYKLVSDNGECSPSKDTPPTHKPRLRLLAARLLLKLCLKKHTDALLVPAAFNNLALVAFDPVFQVRSSFFQRLKKYLGRQKLPQRFYSIPFLLAFEPNTSLKSETGTWIRSRANFFLDLNTHQSSSKAKMVMESVFARLISILAHHPDYDASTEDLVDFARYIVFYLQNVATEENLSLIFSIAQRVKQMHDAITPSQDYDNNLYHLSDLAQLTIRKFEDAHNWSIQTMPGKVRLPTSLFTEVHDHEEAQQIAEKNYLPEGVEEGVEGLVRTSMRSVRYQGRKRKSEANENGEDRGNKRAKQLPIRKGPPKEKKVKAVKTPKKTKRKGSDEEVASSERRKSGRVHASGGKYAERDDEEDDEEMVEGVAAWKYEGGEVVNGDGDVIEGDSEVDENEDDDESLEGEPDGEVGVREKEPPESEPEPAPKANTKAKRATGKGSRRPPRAR